MNPPAPEPQASSWPWLGGLALLCLAMFLDALVAPGQWVLGRPDTDVPFQFLPWREFGFRELAKGNLPLWNPHIFAGSPFFGGMQSALLYPPNWLFMALPLPLAANWSIALSIWMLGAFMYLWGLQRRLHPFAAFVSAAVLMFCAPLFLRVSAGHLTNLAAMAWVPLIFLAIDAWLRERKPVWCMVGMLAVAMQIFAGHPQYVYFTAMVAGGYSLLRLLEYRDGRLATAAGLAALYAGGTLLAAVQLLAGIEATSETVRDLPLPFEFAASFGFPPENFITLLAPGFFGDAMGSPYWGRWYLWEACAFIGVSGLALAAFGIATARTEGKGAMLAMMPVTALLALGASTPLFRVLFDWLPFFDKFRGAGKFIFFTVLLLALLAGCGLDRVLRERVVPRAAIWTGATIALALCAAAAAIRVMDWGPVVALALASGQSYAPPSRYVEPGFVAAAQRFAWHGLLLAGLVLAAVAALAFWARFEKRAALVLGAFAIVEVFVFARMHRPMFDSTQMSTPELRQFLARDPGDYRVLNLAYPNGAMSMGAFDGWGYDPGVTRRYAEFMQWSEGGDPAMATQQLTFGRFHHLLSMLRVKYVVIPDNGAMRILPAAVAPLHRVELVGSYQVQSGRAAILRALGEPSFDPLKQVVLEREPRPAPVAAPSQGRATVVRDGTDFMEIDADVAAPSLLLVTDAWTPAWRATPLMGSSSASYEVLPANYALRAVALSPGKHRLRLEYAPASFRVGAAVSVLAWIAWLAAALLLWRRKRTRAHA
jgi:hypothetical protein